MRIKPASSKNGHKKETVLNEGTGKWDLHLYVAGQNKKAATALKNLKIVCEEQLKGNYQIHVVDLLKTPRRAHDCQILAIPTLVRTSPLPVKNIIGDLSNTERLLVGLELLNDETRQRM